MRSECNETNVCKHDEDVKDPGAGASDVLVTTNNRPLITKTNLDQGQSLDS